MTFGLHVKAPQCFQRLPCGLWILHCGFWWGCLGTHVVLGAVMGTPSARKEWCKSPTMVLTEPGADVSFLWWGCLGPHVACGPFMRVESGLVKWCKTGSIRGPTFRGVPQGHPRGTQPSSDLAHQPRTHEATSRQEGSAGSRSANNFARAT